MKFNLKVWMLCIAMVLCAGCLRIVVHGDPSQAAERMPETMMRAVRAALPPVRVATYNVSLHGDRTGALITRLEQNDLNARHVAAVIQKVRPDIILLNEFDFDAEGRAADLFQQRFLEVPQFGEAAIVYPYRYFAPVNTGVASGFDLDRDGNIGKSGRAYGNDAWGYGLYPGQYGMLVLSRYPIASAHTRSFKNLKWASIPGATSPINPVDGKPWYPERVWQRMPVSSKSHWDVPILTPQGRIHLLAAHPTPPAFDGPEDRNGHRNAAEIQFWNAYIASPNASWLCDESGLCGGLTSAEPFVVVGDLNADPKDGDGHHSTINALISNPRVSQYDAPRSRGGLERANAYALQKLGDNATHTADFGPRVGTLRVDYVLPSKDLIVEKSGIFWPTQDNPSARWTKASDHHLVWADMRAATPK